MNVIVRTRKTASLCSLIVMMCASLTLLSACNEDKPVQPPDTEPEDTTTTSHDFQFQVFTLGDGASMLQDVAIINDTLAYAVGVIYVKDSTGQYILPPYNLAKWNGKNWELSRVWFKFDVVAGNDTRVSEAVGVLAFGEDDLLVSSGGCVMHKSQGLWKRLGILFGAGWQIGSPWHLWGRSSKDFYGVGGGGSIVHWNGGAWEKIESGTTLEMQDIWGAYNPKTGKDEILCMASEKDTENGKRILRVEENMVVVLDSSGLANQLGGIWFTANKRYYAVGAGVHWKQPIDSPQPWSVYKPGEVTSYFSNAIRGNAPNDIVVAGAFSEIVHFNGRTWRNFRTDGVLRGSFLKIAIKGNLIIAVGYYGQKGTIAVGNR